MAKNSGEIRCSFCNKTQDQVKKLIAGPAGVYICDECVDICADIIEEEFEDEPAQAKDQHTRSIGMTDQAAQCLLRHNQVTAQL